MCEGRTPAIKSRQLIMRSVSGPHRMSTVKGGKRILMRNRPRRLRTILDGWSWWSDWLQGSIDGLVLWDGAVERGRGD